MFRKKSIVFIRFRAKEYYGVKKERMQNKFQQSIRLDYSRKVNREAVSSTLI